MTQETTEVTGTQLVTLDPEKYVTAVFAPFRERLEAAKAEATAVTNIDVSTMDGMRVAIKHRAALRTIRVDAEKARQLRKRPIIEIGRLLDSRYKEIEGEITPLEDRFDAAIKAEERRKEEERIARERAEAERVTRIRDSIQDMRAVLLDVAGRSAAEIEAAIKGLVAIECSKEVFQEFQGDAIVARDGTIAKLRDMHAAQAAAEVEAARLKAEREELARQRAEQERREREERARAEAEAKRIAEAEAARRREIEEQERAARERIEAQEREARERREAEEQRLQAERERLAAEARALEERQREERMAQEERERQERLAREAAEREAREAAEAEQRKRDDETRAERLVIEERERAAQRRALEVSDVGEALKALRQRAAPFPEFAWFVKAFDAQTNPKPARSKRAATA